MLLHETSKYIVLYCTSCDEHTGKITTAINVNGRLCSLQTRSKHIYKWNILKEKRKRIPRTMNKVTDWNPYESREICDLYWNESENVLLL